MARGAEDAAGGDGAVEGDGEEDLEGGAADYDVGVGAGSADGEASAE